MKLSSVQFIQISSGRHCLYATVLFCYWSTSSIQIATRRYQDANLYATPPIWSIRSEHGFTIARSLSSDPSMARAGSERSDPIRSILTDQNLDPIQATDRIVPNPVLLFSPYCRLYLTLTFLYIKDRLSSHECLV